MSNRSVFKNIERIEGLADAVPYARSVAELRSLASQAMGSAIAVKEELESYGISSRSDQMMGLLREYDYGNNVETLKRNLQIVLHQTAGYFRSLANRI